MSARSFSGKAGGAIPKKGVALMVCLLCAGTASKAEDKIEDKNGGLQQMSLEEILNVKVTVASRTETSLTDAPSVVSVITAEDIRRMGARDLRDVLRTVPGFELGIGVFGYPEFGLRGVITPSTEKIRILLDGLPVNENLEGSGTAVFGDLTLDNVERIEIIRGPGSALYGTNAFVGVISIITKAPPPSGGATTVTARAGSFHTKEGSVLTGWSGPKFRFSAFLHYLNTEGPRSPIAQDAHPVPSLSLAGTTAGHTDEFRKKLTAQVKFELGSFYFHGAFVDARKGPYIGANWVVNAHSEAHPYQAQGEVGWTLRPTENLLIEPKIYELRYKADNLWNLYPDGFPPTYSKGLYTRNGATQDILGSEIRATWTLPREHKVVLGVSAERERLYALVNTLNVPGFGPENMFDAGPIVRGAPSRTLTSAYLQDQWGITRTLGLTAGLRLDHYSDAGTKTTPRMALVWSATSALNFKAMYGEAFRAPTFVESYLYVAVANYFGREDNKPEAIRTMELDASYRFGDRALWRINLFHNRIKDLISFVPITGGGLEYKNVSGETVVKGIETEVKIKISDSFSAFLNYSSQSGRNEATGESLRGTANWRGNAGCNLDILDRLSVSASLNVVGERERASGDSRPALSGYHVVDMAVTFRPIPHMELSLTAHNLLDADQRFNDLGRTMPGDFPWEGRNIQAGIRWTF